MINAVKELTVSLFSFNLRLAMDGHGLPIIFSIFPRREKNMALELFECENGCGYEHKDIALVEAHEKECTFKIEDTPEMAQLRIVLEATMEHDQAFPFNEPVDWKALKLREYPKVATPDPPDNIFLSKTPSSRSSSNSQWTLVLS